MKKLSLRNRAQPQCTMLIQNTIGGMVERLYKGLQILGRRFESGYHLQLSLCTTVIREAPPRSPRTFSKNSLKFIRFDFGSVLKRLTSCLKPEKVPILIYT